MIISGCVVHPAIATCTVHISDMDEDEACLRCLDGIGIVSGPLSGNFNHKVTVDRGRKKLSGRMDLRTFWSDRTKQEDARGSIPTYINLSSSCLLFQVSLSGKCWTCSPSTDCLKLICSRCGNKFSMDMVNNRLLVHIWLSAASNDTHIKISTTGSLTTVGSPNSVGGVAMVLAEALEYLLSKQEWCMELLGTLRVMSMCGSTMKVS